MRYTRCFGTGARWWIRRHCAGAARVCEPGRLPAEALKNIREAIELYVDDCRAAGDPVPTEAGKEFVETEAA
jgi:hypothetical protein